MISNVFFYSMILFIQLIMKCTCHTEEISNVTKNMAHSGIQVQDEHDSLMSLSVLFKQILDNLSSDLNDSELILVRKYFAKLLDAKRPTKKHTNYWRLRKRT